jgi:hypothetical protein
MLKQVYLAIQSRLKERLTEWEFHFDLWNNQLDNLDNEHPILFPALFLDFSNLRWETTSKLVQEADAVLRLYVVQEPYGEAYSGSLDQARALEYLDRIDAVNEALHGFAKDPYFGALSRSLSESQQQYGELVVWVLEYRCRLVQQLPEPPGVQYVHLGLAVRGEFDPESDGVDARPPCPVRPSSPMLKFR